MLVLSIKDSMFSSLFVCLLTWTDFDETFKKGWNCAKDETFKILRKKGKLILQPSELCQNGDNKLWTGFD